MNLITENFSKEELKFLDDLMHSVSPSGKEGEAAAIIQNFLQDYYITETDILGNLYVYSGSLHPQPLLITAHIDEIGFQITRVNDNGLAYVRKLGESDRQTLAGTLLQVCGKSNYLIGLFGKIAPHLQNSSERNQVIDTDSLWVDFGFVSKDEAFHYIDIGDYLGIAPNFRFDITGKSCISKGLDNKFGAFVLAISLKRLACLDIFDGKFVAVFTTQEELGYRGAILASQRLKPSKCICIDVGFATDIPSMRNQTSISEFYLHHGPGLCIAPDNNFELTQELIEIASQKAIPYQISTSYKPVTGTETARIQLAGSGVVSAHISIPNRYMHSAVEMCSLIDAHYTINLLTEYLSSHFLRVM